MVSRLHRMRRRFEGLSANSLNTGAHKTMLRDTEQLFLRTLTDLKRNLRQASRRKALENRPLPPPVRPLRGYVASMALRGVPRVDYASSKIHAVAVTAWRGEVQKQHH